MAGKRGGERINGPYRDDRGWLYDYFDGQGGRTRVRLPPGTAEEDAREAVAGRRAEIDAPDVTEVTVRLAVALYAESLTSAGDKCTTVAWTHDAARALVARVGELPIASLTGRHLLRYLLDLAAPRPKGPKAEPTVPALATQRAYWLGMRRMAAWWAARRLVRTDVALDAERLRAQASTPLPWATKAGAVAMGRGKAQLRGESEVGRYLAEAEREPDAERRVAAQLGLRSGLSSGEILHLTAGRVDFDGGALWVDDFDTPDWNVKTAKRRRSAVLPVACAADLRELVDGRRAAGLLFRQTDGLSKGKARSASWLADLVAGVCERAKVRAVTPHGLRGTYQTILRERLRRSMADIGEAVGHADGGKTAERSYVGAGERRAELHVVQGGAGKAGNRS